MMQVGWGNTQPTPRFSNKYIEPFPLSQLEG